MTLHTRICDLLQIEVPILLAGMGGASTPELAAAVSNAGGLGVLGAAGCGPKQLREWIRRTRELTDRPFGVDTLLPASVRRAREQAQAGDGPRPADQLPELRAFAERFMEEAGLEPMDAAALQERRDPDEPIPLSAEFFEQQMEVVCEEKVPLYVSGLGNPGPWMERLKANGTRVGAVVGKVKHAVQVKSSGVDFIVAQGHDGGGHNSPIGTMALIPQVVDAVGGLPVLGAGGIADGRGVAAALMLGAEGAWIGSAFLASNEAGIHDFQKQAIVDAAEDGTTISRAVTGKPARIIRSLWTDYWVREHRDPLPMPFQGMIASPVLAAANRAGRGDVNPGFAGQGIGMVRAVRPAGEILRALAAGAEEALGRLATQNPN
ncbi:MAG: nitronate monooxygenase family protein [Pseudomonadales bacterium]|jgi:NAD(P)H-dependent flavin oxidoreductase YrpB (nitropropane dioxygenase family)|nr:nitronate monooxygenase family protein [Pseudomonadales bacterium]